METSDLRRGLCMAVCTTVMGMERRWKDWLLAELNAMPFERRTDAALVTLAEKALGKPRVADIVKRHSATRYEVNDLVLCLECRDTHLVEVTEGRFATCRNCCPLPETVTT